MTTAIIIALIVLYIVYQYQTKKKSAQKPQPPQPVEEPTDNIKEKQWVLSHLQSQIITINSEFKDNERNFILMDSVVYAYTFSLMVIVRCGPVSLSDVKDVISIVSTSFEGISDYSIEYGYNQAIVDKEFFTKVEKFAPITMSEYNNKNGDYLVRYFRNTVEAIKKQMTGRVRPNPNMDQYYYLKY
ncbi:hypothetical protein ACTFWT_16905 [Proteus penneri]|uniref:hypothetical protein n=1 Tax=Proteus penneri TaxID=102862 RepID=UPI003F769B14